MTLPTSFPAIGKPAGVAGVSVLRGERPGPRVGLMGLLHGNEPSGLALWQVARQIGRPLCGEIWLILGHPGAVDCPGGPVRFLEEDINRLFVVGRGPQPSTDSADRRRALALIPVLAELDLLIDIHSTSLPTVPFALVDGRDPVGLRLAATLPIAQLYGLDRFVRGTAHSWVRRHGGSAISIETGRHDDLKGPKVAADMVTRILEWLGMVPARCAGSPAPKVPPQRHVAVVQHVRRVHPGFTYSRSLRNLERLRPGELIGRDQTATYRAPEIDHAVIVMPASEASIANGISPDAFFVGVELDFLPNILGQIQTGWAADKRRPVRARRESTLPSAEVVPALDQRVSKDPGGS